MTLADTLAELPALLDASIERYRVPGASVAVLAGDETFECASGVVNLDTGVETTTDAVFQIGSITKVWTTTLIMQLVDEGRLDLDAPVQTYLPEFQLGDAAAARGITVRHLLTHASGLDGDFFEDTGRGDDCVERFVLACRALPQLHPPGGGFSYCNAGFVIAGRIVERLRGMTWDDALQTFLAEPIEASTLESLPDQMAYYRTAIGHVPDGNGDFQVAPIPFLPRSNGPAGSTPYGAARDVLQLAKLHLAGGRAPDGSQVLSEASAQAMQESQVAVPPAMTPDEWGLGWMLFDWDGRRLIGHDGSTLGQNSYLRIVPDDGVAVVVMANGGNAAALYRRIVGAVLDPLTSIAVPPLPEATGHTIDPSRYLGVYERLAHRMVIELRGDELWMSAIELRPFNPEAPEAPEAQLHPVDDHLFVYTTPDSGFRNQLSFGDPDEDGRFTWAFMGRRLPRVS